MKANYNVTGNERKVLVAAIAELTGEKPIYKFMPTCAYDIGDITVDKEGAALHYYGGTVYPKSVADMKELVKMCAPLPFIVKGVMSAKGALKAAEAGVYGIVVSNHGGRVLDSSPATAEVLPEIRAALGENSPVKIFMDGGIRTGLDVFKAIALGADAVLIGRPIITASFGGGAEGVEMYLKKVAAELVATMLMTGAANLKEITRDMVRLPK